MVKLKTVYVCQECGAQQGKWAGSCNGCNVWNSLVEDVINVGKVEEKKRSSLAGVPTVRKISDVDHNNTMRLVSGMSEFDRVLGGGLVAGSVVLLAGEPGIGKSTLMLQVMASLSNLAKISYIAGEESVEQIAMRAERLAHKLANVDFFSTTDLQEILAGLNASVPDLVVVDSISVVSDSELGSFPGSIPQVRSVTEKLIYFAKQNRVPVLLIGHVTKEGTLAGPRVMEHMVDTVLQFEGDRYQQLRLLRSLKNRFGSTQDVGVFEMDEKGLIELTNPGVVVLKGRPEQIIGSALAITMDGRRPFCVEIQALVTPSHFGYPKRVASGFDLNRMNLIIAVLEKHFGLRLGDKDVYLNVLGGLKIKEPGCDLAVLEAIRSSYSKEPLPGAKAFIGEVGLDGATRSPILAKIRQQEAQRLGLD